MKNKLFSYLKSFAYGEFTLSTKNPPKKERREGSHREKTLRERYLVWHDNKANELFKGIYTTASFVICFVVIVVLLITVSFLPEFGDPDNPTNNEVSERYIEKGLEETGATNLVAGMILDYRAFDTFGESAVLLSALIIVMLLLKERGQNEISEAENEYRSLPRDTIVKSVARLLIPFLLMFGIYVVLNGHLSPGGGFSGGAIMGAGLILYSSAYGYPTVKRVVTEKLVKTITVSAFCFYAVAKGYSFFTGANHIETGIPLGTPGNIISAGLILPLNICVGMIVACTVYSIYSLFSKGEI